MASSSARLSSPLGISDTTSGGDVFGILDHSGGKSCDASGFEPGSAKHHGPPASPFDRSATWRVGRVLIIWRLHPRCTNICATRDPREDPRRGPRLYDDSPNAASSTHAVASAQNPASKVARTAPRPPGGPPPEEADGANYILPPGTSSLSQAEAVPRTSPQQRAPGRALVRRPEGAGNPRAPLGTDAPILS